jgi:hypothetical protein
LAGARDGAAAATRDAGLRVLATLEGATLIARALGDPAAFDRATAGWVRHRSARVEGLRSTTVP